MTPYEKTAFEEMKSWQKDMRKSPSIINRITKGTQRKINLMLPEKFHQIVTAGIKQMTRSVIFGAGFTSPKPLEDTSFETRENKVRKRIKIYRNTAATEGGVTGAGGILMGFADFPLWLTLKMKMLFDIASLYGFNVKDYKERLYLLHIFQLTFSSQQHRNKIYPVLKDWEKEKEKLPEDIHQFDWRSFQLEYRDYIDLAKLLQLIPGFGAFVGAIVNHRLTDKLGQTAMNAYRMRIFLTSKKRT